MGRASELDEWLEKHPLTSEEVEMRDGPRPPLRLGADILRESLGPETPAKDVLERLSSTVVGNVAVMRDASGTTAVAVPVDRYLELVSSYIRDRQLSEVNLDGRIAPSDGTLGELGVEQVNPRDTWIHVDGYDPNQPAPSGT
jgi:hypothetical protein